MKTTLTEKEFPIYIFIGNRNMNICSTKNKNRFKRDSVLHYIVTEA